MTKHIVIDIETMPREAAQKYLPEVKADPRLKDEVKIAASIKQKQTAQIEKMALSPLYGEMAFLGWRTADESGGIFGEDDILSSFKDLIAGRKIITYNGNNFDIPFIFKRGMIKGVDGFTIPAMEFYTKRFSALHKDVMLEFCGYGAYEKLDTLANVFFDMPPEDYDVAMIKDDIKTEEGRKAIHKYCVNGDCLKTQKLGYALGLIDD